MAGPLSELVRLCLAGLLITESANLGAASTKGMGTAQTGPQATELHTWNMTGHLGVCGVQSAELHLVVS